MNLKKKFFETALTQVKYVNIYEHRHIQRFIYNYEY